MLCLLLAGLTATAFAPSLDNGFLSLDDPAYVTANPRVLRGLTGEGLRWALGARHAANWHPLTWLSHMADADLFGADPRGHHLASLVLHAGATLGLFLFLAGATGAAGRSFFAAALFGLHPLRVESVAWVAERKDVLAAALGMLTLLAYLRHARRPSPARLLAVLALLAAGLAAKPTLLTLPALLLVLDVWPLGRLRPGAGGRGPALPALLAEKALLLLPAAGSLALTLLAQREAGTIVALPWPARVANALANHLHYLATLAWPADLHIPHLLPAGGAAPAAVAGGLAALAALSTLAWSTRRAAPFVAAGWVWYLVASLPMIGLVQFVNQSVADRYTYLPSIGFGLAVVWGAAISARPWARAAALATGAVAIALLVPASRAQTRFWKDDASLFGHAAAVDPDNPAAAVNLGTALLNAGAYAQAETVLRASLARHPDFVPGRMRLAGVLLELGRPGEAAAALAPALSREPLNVDLRVRLGLALLRSGRIAQARSHLETALRLRPGDPAGLEALRELHGGPGQGPRSSSP